tara:strand:- start:119 stop:244 length:126 start_codon:yes stop_codon:yes gene_type:complete
MRAHVGTQGWGAADGRSRGVRSLLLKTDASFYASEYSSSLG